MATSVSTRLRIALPSQPTAESSSTRRVTFASCCPRQTSKSFMSLSRSRILSFISTSRSLASASAASRPLTRSLSTSFSQTRPRNTPFSRRESWTSKESCGSPVLADPAVVSALETSGGGDKEWRACTGSTAFAGEPPRKTSREGWRGKRSEESWLACMAPGVASPSSGPTSSFSDMVSRRCCCCC